jgi:short subunit dehydrogenase-like uncharacterized protein
MTDHTSKKFDLVVFGATSFVGQILCAFLFARHGVGDGLNWALAGRSRSKLESLRNALGEDAAGLELIVCDAADEAGLRGLCRNRHRLPGPGRRGPVDSPHDP